MRTKVRTKINTQIKKSDLKKRIPNEDNSYKNTSELFWIKIKLFGHVERRDKQTLSNFVYRQMSVKTVVSKVQVD